MIDLMGKIIITLTICSIIVIIGIIRILLCMKRYK